LWREEKMKFGVVSQCGNDESAAVLLLSNLLFDRLIRSKYMTDHPLQSPQKKLTQRKKGYLYQS
jgi:hypothetical protein